MAKRKKPKSVTTTKKKAWSVFAKLVKLSAADDQGYCYCYTCGKKMMWNDPQLHAGHFRTRGCNATLFNRQNVKPQCSGCNMFRGGEQFIFARNLDAEHGTGTAEALTIESRKTRQFTVEELEEMISDWKDELRKLGLG